MSALFDSIKQGLNEAIEYERGDKSKGRSDVISVSDDELKFYSMYGKLSDTNKNKAMNYVSELLQAANQ